MGRQLWVQETEMRETIVHLRTVSGLLLDFKPARVSNHPLSEHQAEGEPGFIHVQCAIQVLFMVFCACNTGLFPAFFVTSSKLVSRRSFYMVFQSSGSPYIFSNHWLIPCILGSPLTYISQKIKCYFKLPAVPDRMAFHKQHELASRILLHSTLLFLKASKSL